LKDKIEPFNKEGIAAIVLGCTHYPFIKKSLSEVLENKVPIIDGSKGTARQLKRQLIKYNIINKRKKGGNVEISNSLNNSKIINLSYKLLNPNE
jgi:glutamate racemase